MAELGKVGIIVNHNFGFDLFNRKKLNWLRLEISQKEDTITRLENEIKDLRKSLSENDKSQCKVTKWFKCDIFGLAINQTISGPLSAPFSHRSLQNLVSACELLDGKDIRFVEVNATGTSVRAYYKDVDYPGLIIDSKTQATEE